MGKAFTDKERELIKENIKKEAFKLFKINGIRKTSIGQITKNSGISQGGFYSFYKNKEELFYEIIDDDMDLQIEHMLSYMDESVKDPAKMLYTSIKHNCMHMMENRAIWLDEPDIMEILNSRKEEDSLKEKEKFRRVVDKLYDFWIDKKCISFMNKDKLVSVFLIARTMYINKECCNDVDFEEIFDIFIKNSINKYLKTNVKSELL